MNISQAGIDLIKHFEGFRGKAYICPAGVPTQGYGSTGPHVKMGTTITKDEAETLLRKDLRRFEEAVSIMVKTPLEQHEYDALVAFVFNVGVSAFCTSTLLKKLNKGDKDGSVEEFGRWTKGGGKVLPGLVRRRKAEAELFARGSWSR